MDTLMRITDHLTTSPGIQLKIDKRWGASVTFVTRSIAHVRIFRRRRSAARPDLEHQPRFQRHPADRTGAP